MFRSTVLKRNSHHWILKIKEKSRVLLNIHHIHTHDSIQEVIDIKLIQNMTLNLNSTVGKGDIPYSI